MRPAPTQLDPLDALVVFALSVTLLFAVGALVLADLGLAGIVLGQLLFIAGPALAVARKRSGTLRAAASLLGFRAARPQALLGAALVGISFWYLNEALLWPVAERYLEGRETVRELEEIMLPEGRSLWIVLVAFACVPAVCEEILLRGAVARGLRPSLGLAGAVLASSLLFGLLHVLPAQVLSTAVFGVPLAYAALASGSLVPSVLMHFLNNAITILLASGALPFLATAIQQVPTLAAVSAGVLSTLGLALLWRSRALPDAEPSSS